jgi:hypothetical protein
VSHSAPSTHHLETPHSRLAHSKGIVTPGIFISYRREDAPGHAGRLYDALVARFGDGQVFMDLDMELGVDFVEQINDAVGSCRLLVAVVGPRWATVEDAPGRRRLDDPADFVRVLKSRPGSARRTYESCRCWSRERGCRGPTNCRHHWLTSRASTRSS